MALRVLNKRFDGYHDVCSLYWRLVSPETLEVSFGQTDEISVTGAEIPGENILAAACRHIRKAWGDEALPGARIKLFKHVPMGSGVGAGSGNAAALMRLCGRLGRRSDAISTSAALGADVAFLASEHNLALAGGVGDVLEGLDGDLSLSAVIFFPKWASDTASAYAALDASRASVGGAMSESAAHDEAMSVLGALRDGKRVGLLPNDFMELAPHRPRYDELRARADDSGAVAWGLCGSGSAFFALYKKPNGCGDVLNGCKFEWLRQILVLE
ncbi:MAG: 4-diphosphocytidyl-2C-methyl-D-erythritol kinase [Synergistaceae bacterium]|nr:4-diphosphocytidyl-2C-methyl-D-erythritol kinase [Synergistaceae bacterium]